MTQIIPLSPIDHIFTGSGSYPIEFIFYYEGRLDESSLRSSLHETINYFPAVSSKIIKATDHSFSLEFSGSGLDFTVVELPGVFSEITNRSVFIDPVETFEGLPLAKFRLTHLTEGSVLGVSISHAVADGFSYFYFLSAWSKVYRSQSVIPPDNERKALIPEISGRNETPGYQEIYNNCGLFMLDKRSEFSRENQQWEKIQFTADEIKLMVASAQSESQVRLSVNDIITAHIWKDFGLRWSPGENEIPTYVSCPVDFRRILPGFSRNYFGDALCLATSKLNRSELSGASTSELAMIIRSSISKVNEIFIRSSMETLEIARHQNGLDAMECIHVVHPETGLLVTNLSRLPVNELIFNCGPPTASDILTTAQRGAVILPAEDGLEIRVCLPS